MFDPDILFWPKNILLNISLLSVTGKYDYYNNIIWHVQYISIWQIYLFSVTDGYGFAITISFNVSKIYSPNILGKYILKKRYKYILFVCYRQLRLWLGPVPGYILHIRLIYTPSILPDTDSVYCLNKLSTIASNSISIRNQLPWAQICTRLLRNL